MSEYVNGCGQVQHSKNVVMNMTIPCTSLTVLMQCTQGMCSMKL